MDDMTMTSTAAMDMPSSTATMSMGGDSMSGGSDSSMMMSMADMTMTFFDSIKTPLFSTSWAPSTTGQYAGTCIFLIVLSVILRFMLAFRPILEASVWRAAPTAINAASHADESDKSGLPVRPTQYGWLAFRSELARRWTGWRASTATGRACYELVIAGIGYLLMIAVMTMNTGYFLSVLGGVFLGTFLLGGL